MNNRSKAESSCLSFKLVLWLIWSCIKLYTIGIYALIKQLYEKQRKQEPIESSSDGLIAIVTGGSSGIGYQVARKLALRNVHVIIASRNKEEAALAIQRIHDERSTAKVGFIELDLSSLKSVEGFVQTFLALDLPLHILVNNAGVMLVPYCISEDHMETHFQVNYLSHLYLTCLLVSKMKASARQDMYARVINVSSIVHWGAELSDIQARCDSCENYSPHTAYAASKLAVVMGTYSLSNQLKGNNSYVSVNAVHPGVVNSDLYNNVHWSVKWIMAIMRHLFFMTASDSGEKIVHLALSPEVEGHTGGYYDNYKFVQSKGCTYSAAEQSQLSRLTNQELDVDLSLLLS